MQFSLILTQFEFEPSFLDFLWIYVESEFEAQVGGVGQYGRPFDVMNPPEQWLPRLKKDHQ